MKNDYILHLAFDCGFEKDLCFHTTRSKIDKLFFDFAFCLPCSNIACVDLFVIPSVKCNVVDCKQLINRVHKVGCNV